MDPNARRSSEGCAGAEPAVPNPENGEKHSAEEKVGPLGPPRNRVGACRVRDWRPTAAGLRCDSGAVDEARRAIRLPLTRPVRSFRAVTDQECTQHTPTGGRRQGIQAGTDPPDAHGAHGASMVLPTLVSALQSHPPTLGKARTTQTRELPDQTAWEFATVLCGGGGIRRQPVMTCEHTTKPDTSGSVAWGPWQGGENVGTPLSPAMCTPAMDWAGSSAATGSTSTPGPSFARTGARSPSSPRGAATANCLHRRTFEQ